MPTKRLLDDYYPFGLAFNSYQSGLKNDYLYNGKELQEDLDLNWYDYGARFYDPALGRMSTTDPLADRRDWLSPYNYVQNNPVLRIDPSGLLDIFSLDKESGNINLVKKTDDTTDELVDSETGKTVSSNVDKGLLSDGQNIMQNGLETSNVSGGIKLVTDISMHTNDEVGGVVYQNDAGHTYLTVSPYKHSTFDTNEKGEVIRVGAGFGLPLGSETITSTDGSFTGTTKYQFHTHPGHPNGIGNIGTAIPSLEDIGGAMMSEVPQIIIGAKSASYENYFKKTTTGNSSYTFIPPVMGTHGMMLPGAVPRTTMFNREF